VVSFGNKIDMNKIHLLYTEYKGTRVLAGSTFLFAIFFWITKLFSFFQQRSAVLNNIIHTLVQHLPKPTFTIQNKSGIFTVSAFDDSTTICSDYFERQIRGWLTEPDTKDIFVDIGANRGIYTIIAPTLFGYSEVHAFEPNPPVGTILTTHVALNNLQDKVTIHQTALGEQSETLLFDCDPMHLGGGRIVSTTSKHTISVPVTLFDDFISTIPPTRIGFIKIDTEGFEQSVLKGMTETLAAMPVGSCIMIEATQVEQTEAVLAQFKFKREKSIAHDHLFKKHA
jgi:FkbM family methyltransferase